MTCQASFNATPGGIRFAQATFNETWRQRRLVPFEELADDERLDAGPTSFRQAAADTGHVDACLELGGLLDEALQALIHRWSDCG